MPVVRCVTYIMMGTCDTIRHNSLNRVMRIEYVPFVEMVDHILTKRLKNAIQWDKIAGFRV